MPFRADSTNNCGNLKGGGSWHGLIGSDAQGHNEYDTLQNGIRAMARNIESFVEAGHNTPRKLVEEWTDRSADWDSYTLTVKNALRIAPDTPLRRVLFTFEPDGTNDGKKVMIVPAFLNLIPAMAIVEQGAGYHMPMSTILEGLAFYSRDFLHD